MANVLQEDESNPFDVGSGAYEKHTIEWHYPVLALAGLTPEKTGCYR
jgi:hypothetical protein